MKLKTLLPLLLLTSASAFASFSFTLSPTVIVSPPGGLPDSNCTSGFCVAFSGTITSDSTNYVAINDVVIDFSTPGGDTFLSNGDCLGSASGTEMCNYFFGSPFTGPPSVFFPGDPDFTGGIFAIDVDPNTPLGLYSGTVTLLGDVNSDVSALDFSATNVIAGPIDFQLDVETPEPATFGLMLLGLAAGACALRKRAI